MNIYLKENLKYILRSPLLIQKFSKEVEFLKSLSEAELRQRNEKRFLKIFRLAYTKAPFYRQLYEKAQISLDDIKTLKDIEKLPVITKEMIRECPERLLTCRKWHLIRNHTSGTTGTPLTVFESWPSVWMAQAYLNSYRKQCGFYPGERMVSLRGNLLGNRKSMYVHISNTLFLSSYHINEENISFYYKKIAGFQPIAIEGYPSSLYLMCLLFKSRGMQLRIPLTFTSSETLSDEQRKVIESVLNTQIYDHYGMTERTIQLDENLNHQGYFETPGFSINEFVGNEIITTSLINSAFPLIRYKISDSIELLSPANIDNSFSNSNKIRCVIGRTEDYIVCKDGTKIVRLGFVVKDIAGIKMAQIIQYRQGEVEIRVVHGDILSEESAKKIRNNMIERTGKGNMEIVVKQVPFTELIMSPSNKYRYILNLAERSQHFS